MSDLLWSEKAPLHRRSITYLVVLLCLPFFFTYYYATKSIVSLHGQFKVREQAILSGKEQQDKAIYIPNYYVGKLYKPSDSIDLYQGDLNAFYNVKSNIKIVPFDKDFSFDYSNKKLINARQIPVNRSFGDEIRLKAINIFPDKRNFNKYSINLTFDNDLLKEYMSDDSLLFIHVNWNRDSTQGTAMLNADTSLNNQLFIDGKYIFSSPIGDVRPQDIKSVDVGIYSMKSKTNIVQTTVNMKNQ